MTHQPTPAALAAVYDHTFQFRVDRFDPGRTDAFDNATLQKSSNWGVTADEATRLATALDVAFDQTAVALLRGRSDGDVLGERRRVEFRVDKLAPSPTVLKQSRSIIVTVDEANRLQAMFDVAEGEMEAERTKSGAYDVIRERIRAEGRAS